MLRQKLSSQLTLIALLGSLCLSLTGCVAAVVTAGVVSAGILVYQHEKVEKYVSNEMILATAKNRLYGDKSLYADSHIVVAVDRGTVLLAGQAVTEKAKKQAEELVKAIEGVNQLYNEITVEPKISLWQQSQDAAITAKIKTHMLQQKHFDTGAIQVITENKVVYLMGLVTPSQAEDAVNLVKEVDGVTKIVKIFQYIK